MLAQLARIATLKISRGCATDAVSEPILIVLIPVTLLSGKYLNGARNSRRIVDLLKKQTVASVM
jgi:hypothetical protein